jgi:hypothetical protein
MSASAFFAENISKRKRLMPPTYKQMQIFLHIKRGQDPKEALRRSSLYSSEVEWIMHNVNIYNNGHTNTYWYHMECGKSQGLEDFMASELALPAADLQQEIILNAKVMGASKVPFSPLGEMSWKTYSAEKTADLQRYTLQGEESWANVAINMYKDISAVTRKDYWWLTFWQARKRAKHANPRSLAMIMDDPRFKAYNAAREAFFSVLDAQTSLRTMYGEIGFTLWEGLVLMSSAEIAKHRMGVFAVEEMLGFPKVEDDSVRDSWRAGSLAVEDLETPKFVLLVHRCFLRDKVRKHLLKLRCILLEVRSIVSERSKVAEPLSK